MEKANETPRRLFKYRSFSDLTLEMLITDQVYFADPSTFNDPLDTKPQLDADIDSAELERIFLALVEQREKQEMTAAAKKIGYRGERTVDHIMRSSRRKAEQLLSEVRYQQHSPLYDDYSGDNLLDLLLTYCLQDELLKRYDRGVFSLAERANCPLMWSHYGDQHKGVCIGFSLTNNPSTAVHKVNYGGNRLVKASTVVRMLDGDESARQEVDQAILANKAGDWSYEKEWRAIGQRGLQDTSLEVEEVIFGMRCKPSVKFSVKEALKDRQKQVSFFEISTNNLGDFSLKKIPLDMDSICEFPRRSVPPSEAFGQFRN